MGENGGFTLSPDFSNYDRKPNTVPLKSKLPPLVSRLARRKSRLARRDSRLARTSEAYILE